MFAFSKINRCSIILFLEYDYCQEHMKKWTIFWNILITLGFGGFFSEIFVFAKIFAKIIIVMKVFLKICISLEQCPRQLEKITV
jgi:hypothetical protein